MSIWINVSPMIITSAAVSVSITEIGGYFTMLVREWEERWARKRAERLEREEQLKDQVRQETHVLWLNWLERKNQGFDDPPPHLADAKREV